MESTYLFLATAAAVADVRPIDDSVAGPATWSPPV